MANFDAVHAAADVSIVIATRNRGPRLLETVDCILRNNFSNWELIIIDQSTGSATSDALRVAGLMHDPRLRYEQVATTGACRARNYGMTLAKGGVLMFTDDDCIVPQDWIELMLGRFQADPKLDVCFGGVVIPPTHEGWGYQFQPHEDGIIQPGYKNLCEKFGLASNMAIRRSAIARIGPFDEMLGAGAPFAPADDTDYGYRALRLGCRVFAALEPTVTHLGIVRRGKTTARQQIGMAAMSAKHVRCGDIAMLRPPLGYMLIFIGEATGSLLKGRRPSGYRSAAYLLLGMIRSLRHPIDVGARIYRTESGVPAPRPG
jgi:glycosyltransferase involved in cell wall biosynthesis